MEQPESSTTNNCVVIHPDDRLDIATARNDITIQDKDWFKEILNSVKCKQNPVILNKCISPHVGPKIEVHYPQPERYKENDEKKHDTYVHCRKKLKQRYLTYFAYMRSFLWEGKRNDASLKDYFVQLTVEKTDLFGNRSGEYINLKEMFSYQGEEHETILITGDPGFGKTTLCKKIAYDWASEEYLQYFHLTVVVLLRELNNKSISHNISQEIQHNLANSGRKFEGENLNFLVILDGFDELIEKTKVVKFITEDSFDVSDQMTILVTSRPQATEDIREYMTRRFSIEGFSPDDQKKYIKLMFREDPSKAKYLISKLSCDDFYIRIADCPLMLHMLCCIHRIGDMEKVESITDLYIQIFSVITERYFRKTNQKDQFERGRYFFGEEFLRRLGKICLTRNEITSENLKEHFPNDKEYNFIVGLDILTLESFSELESGVRYDFLHRTFSEFLSALTVYGDFPNFPETISENTLLFLLGFYGNDLFPEMFLFHFEIRIFTPYFMIRAHKEIKLEYNWEQLCSVTKVIFSGYDLDDTRKLLQLSSFKMLYFIFSNSFWRSYSSFQGFDAIFSLPNLKIYVFLRDDFHECFSKFIYSVSCLLNFFSYLNINFGPSRVFFNGIYDSYHNFHFLNNQISVKDICKMFPDNSNVCKDGDFCYLKDVKVAMDLCEDILDNFNQSKYMNHRYYINVKCAKDLHKALSDNLNVNEYVDFHGNYRKKLEDGFLTLSAYVNVVFGIRKEKENLLKCNFLKLTMKEAKLLREKISLNEIFSTVDDERGAVGRRRDVSKLAKMRPREGLLKKFLNDCYANFRKNLKERYEINFAYAKAFLYNSMRNDFPLKDHFVQLTVEKTNLDEKSLSLNEILCKEKDEHQTILVTGDPAYGKTTLCKKLAYDWATTEYLEHFSLTIIVVLPELEYNSIKDAIIDKILRYSPNYKKWKMQINANFLVLLDGFDELKKKDKLLDFVRKDSFDISDRMTILVTSRPEATHEIREDMNVWFSIQGFSPELQKKFIGLMFKEDVSKGKELISKLDDDTFYREIAECPLMLIMLCRLHQNGDLDNIRNKNTVCGQMFSLFCKRYAKKNE